MNPGSADRASPWPAVLVGCLGVLVSAVAWGVLVVDRHRQVLATTAEIAGEVGTTTEKELERQVQALRGMTRLWSDFGLRPLPEWEASVGQRVEQIAGLQSVAWVNLSDPTSSAAVGRPRSTTEISRDVAEVRDLYPDSHVSGPSRDASGAPGYRVLLPARTPEGGAGMLVARFRADEVLAGLLEARAPGYALSVSWEDQELFSRGTPASDQRLRWWGVRTEIQLPFGGQWTVTHRPTAALAAARLSPVLHYLLAVGVLLSIVVAVATHQYRVIVRQARFLATSNRALEERGAELEEKVAARTSELEDAVAELEAFNHSVSHDLKSPLSAILNFTAILEEDYRGRPLDEQGLEMLERIRRSAAKATDLLNDLLELSQAGRAALNFEKVDMEALARESFSQASAASMDSDVDFVVEPLPTATGDRTLLGNVFVNLFSNSLKYSRGRQPRQIVVSGHERNGECLYQVEDNGEGFDMRFADKVFGLFQRLHSDDDIEGTGVGLAMVAWIVKRHGGRVSAWGQPGEGARFTFALPRRSPS